MRFVKMHGAGNDFLIVDNRALSRSESELSALAVRFCARHTGVGADGLMAVQPARHGGDYAMLFFNADGSLGEMCGNGARCICRWGYEHGLAGQTQRVETTAGLVTGVRIDRSRYRVRLNDPSVLDVRTVLGPDRLKAVTFERGVEDFTLACGTGCGSITAALTKEGLVSGRDVAIEMPGGELTVSVTNDEGRIRDIFLTGPTCVVCAGELYETE